MSNAFPALRTIYYNPTWRCNLNCKHCWVEAKGIGCGYSPIARAGYELTAGQLGGILDQALELGLLNLKFTGGEPLLRDDFVSLYEATIDRGTSVFIETNGTVEPPGIWQAFQDHPPDSVSVSLDSADQKEHDEFRGMTGCWKRSVGFMRKLRDMGIPFQIVMSIVSLDIDKVDRVLELAGSLGAGSLKVNLPTVMGRGVKLELVDTPVSERLSFVRELYGSYDTKILCNTPPAFCPISRLASRSHCNVLNLLGILSDGRASLCGVGFTRPELVMGNLLEDSLWEIWSGSPILKKLRRDLPARLSGICSNCVHARYCLGHCVMENYVTGGSFTSPNIVCAQAAEAGIFPESRKIDV
jgi:SynChlorMet cassette radical SAM/SPASM protein ScmF